jgi:single-strand DNA-binding protein
MMFLNHVEVIGNLTRDPEMRYTPTNQAVVSFTIATNRRYRDQGGNWVDSPPEYHDIVVWGALAERCNQVLHKGERVFASGRLQTRSWEAQDGSKRYKTELVADTLIGPDQLNKNLGGADGISGTPEAAPAPKPAASKPAAAGPEEEINIDDIPF